MNADFVPYVWMGRGWSGSLELTRDTSHAALVAVAERLCREFGGVVTERSPEGAAEGYKEYWWVSVSGARLLLMRKPPQVPVGLSAEPEHVEVLLGIARAWGVVRLLGWRWWAWRVWRRLAGRKCAE
jgi:hypothetical protein